MKSSTRMHGVRSVWNLQLPVIMSVAAWVLSVSGSASAADTAAWIRSAKSGPWSATETWVGGKVPAAAARVHILPGHQVTYDVQSEQPIRAIYLAGTLSFARDRDTRLD